MKPICFMLLALSLTTGAVAQGPTYGLGKPPTESEIKSMDTLVDQDGKSLPVGEGTPAEGATLFAQRCAVCHGTNGEGTATAAGVGPVLIAQDQKGTRGIRHLHFATTLFSFIHRAMPMHQERSLSVDQAYALTAFLLYRNGIIQEDEEMNAESLPKVIMPNRHEWSLPPETTG